jgi:hypothetical protein
MKRNKLNAKMSRKSKDVRGASNYKRKREFLVAENNRRVAAGLPAVMGFDFPVGNKPWK